VGELAVLLSVAFLLYRASRPYIAALGRMPGLGSTYGDLARHPDAAPVDGLVIARLDAPLYFFNANVAQAQILDLVIAPVPRPRAVLLDLGATADLDVTTGDMLATLVDDLQEHGVTLLLAQVKGPVRDRLRRTGLMERIGEANVHLSVAAGVVAFEATMPPVPPAPSAPSVPPAPSAPSAPSVPPDPPPPPA